MGDVKSMQLRLFGYDLLFMHYYNGLMWLCIFKEGFVIRDVNKHRLIFSEREGYKKYIKIGKWIITRY